MPIYEFYCPQCHMIFNFFSRTINTEKVPPCPKCDRSKLERQMSSFAVIRGTKEDQEDGLPDMDDSKLEKAMTALASEAERINEDDPRQAAQLMRKLTDMTGLELGSGMEGSATGCGKGSIICSKEKTPLFFRDKERVGVRSGHPVRTIHSMNCNES